MATWMRLGDDNKCKGKGCKGNGNCNVRVAGNKEDKSSKVMTMASRMAGKWTATVTKR